MKKLLVLALFVFPFTNIGAEKVQSATEYYKGKHMKDLSGKMSSGYEKRYIEKDLRTTKKPGNLPEGEKKLLRYERIHRFGHLYRLA
jgi:hypothetical protein